ncbi:MAG: hypothetical protein PPP56_00510 [Longimonas sp.]|uniref:hypothetical protein n=1 Tax=Longimonas sp. TaxID=2039626 RepID=UPI00335E910F
MRVSNFILIVLFLSGLLVFSVHAQSIEVGDPHQVSIQDADAPLDAVHFVQPVGQDSLVIADGAGRLTLFVDGAYVTDLGEQGQGPCEHQSILTTSRYASLLFGLDRGQQRLLAYDSESGACLGQIQSSDLRRATGLASTESNLFLTRGQYTSQTESDTPLFFRVEREQTVEDGPAEGTVVVEASFTLADLDPVLLPVPLSVRTPVETHGTSVYFALPLSSKIVRYDRETERFSSFEMDLALPTDDEVESLAPEDLLPLVESDIEFVEHLHVTDDHVVVASRRGTGADGVWRVQVYDHGGAKQGMQTFEHQIVSLTEEYIVQLVTGETEDAVYTVRQVPYVLP